MFSCRFLNIINKSMFLLIYEEYLRIFNNWKNCFSYLLHPTIKAFRGRIDCYANVPLSGTFWSLNAGVNEVVDPPRYARFVFFVLLRGNWSINCMIRAIAIAANFLAAACLESKASVCNLIKYYAMDAN